MAEERSERLLPFGHTVWPLTLGVCVGTRAIASRWARALVAGVFPSESNYATTFAVPGFADAWRVAVPHTLLDVFRLGNIARMFEASLTLPGDVFECGVAGGGTSLLLALLLEQRNSPKKLWLFDSFEGLPDPDRRFDGLYRKGQFAHSLESIQALMDRHGVAHRCVFRKGWFSETLSQVPADQTFCFGHVDCDLYQPARECSAAMYPRVSVGGALVFDDYYDGSGGVFRALNEAAAELDEIIWVGPSCQAMLIKGCRPEQVSALNNDTLQGGTRVCFDALRALPQYSAFLDEALSACNSLRAKLLARISRSKLETPPEFRRSIRVFQGLMRETGQVRQAHVDLLGPPRPV
jgi:O-methyltransferase